MYIALKTRNANVTYCQPQDAFTFLIRGVARRGTYFPGCQNENFYKEKRKFL